MSEISVTLIKPYEAQQVILGQQKRNNLLVLSRRWGKTELAKYVVKKASLVNAKHRCAYSFPTWKLMMETFEQFKNELASVTERVSREDKRIELVNGSVIEFWSSDDTQAGRGRKYHLWVSDETQRQRNLSAFIRGSVRPTLADYRGTLWVLGTANGEGSEFHDFYLDCKEDTSWQVAHGSLDQNPYIHPDEIEQMRRDCGPELAAQELDSQWVRVDGITPLVRSTPWEALYGVKESATHLKTLSIDASVKSDTTAIVAVWTDPIEGLTYVDNTWLIEPDPYTGEIDYEAVEEQLWDIWRTGQYSVLAYDPYQTVSLMQRLKKRGVRTYEFTQNSMRIKADGYLRQLINESRLRHPSDPHLTEHVLNCTLKYAQDNFRLVKGTKNDKIDLAVALSMACYTNHILGQQTGLLYTPSVSGRINRPTPPTQIQQTPFNDLQRLTPWNKQQSESSSLLGRLLGQPPH